MPLLDPIPSPIQHADLAALEWEPLLVLVAGFAASPVGRAAILALHPSTDEHWIALQHRLTAEARLLLEEQVSVALGGLFDPTLLAAKARIPGAALEAAELQAVARLAADISAWQSLLADPPARLAGKLPALSEVSSTFAAAALDGPQGGAKSASLAQLAASIQRTVQPDGSLADDASPELRRLRREQERQQKLIEETLRAALRKLSGEGLLARARFARAYRCVAPAFSPDQLQLDNARHPLLEKRLRSTASSSAAPNTDVIPLTLSLTSETRQLIVSGPNTGGKTVALKTTALLAMMAQAGLPIPAAAAVFPVFTAFLADIGDSQSIEAALSSFSAHILNLDRLSRLADARSLVLLDELGSSTDPEEGAALAVAVAHHFLKAGAWALISTHHTSLKVYAANTSGVRNVAAGVDELTLAPNYQFHLGVPGASAGIQTAERLGLNPSIIAAARQRLGSQQADVARFLEKLHNELAQLEAERKAAREQQYALHQERAKLAREGDQELRNRTRELEQKLASLLKDFEFQMRENVRAIEDRAAQQKLSREAERRINRLRREFQEGFNQTVVAHRTGADQGDQNAQPHLLRHIAPGDRVLLKSMNRIATIQREVEKDLFEVALGPIKMRVRRDECSAPSAFGEEPAKSRETPLAAARKQKGVHVSVTSASADDLRMEINLIGRTVDEATGELEKYLDRAFLAGLPRVRVIHGHGAGILRRGVREFLKNHPHVAGIAEAPQNEGGQGATLVELRQ